MSDPFLGEVRFFGFPFAPRGWAPCNGQLLPINSNQALFAILGVNFGGDGQTTFGLPNLQGRVPMHWGQNGGLTFPFAAKGGEVTHTLTTPEMPAHTHALSAVADTATQKTPNGNAWAKFPNLFNNASTPPPNTSLASGALSSAGSGAPHENRQPYIVGNFCIAIVGIFPSRN